MPCGAEPRVSASPHPPGSWPNIKPGVPRPDTVPTPEPTVFVKVSVWMPAGPWLPLCREGCARKDWGSSVGELPARKRARLLGGEQA